MIAIAVDDEALMLGALVASIEASPDITEVTKFSNCNEALDFAKENPIDVAFLDINMRGINGIALAEKITALHPDCKIVFIVDENSEKKSATQVKQAKKDGLIDQFIYSSISASYLSDIVDSL